VNNEESVKAPFDIYFILDRLNSIYEDHAYGDDYSTSTLRLVNALISSHDNHVDDAAEETDVAVRWVDYADDQVSNRSHVLRTAETHVNGQRNVEYGDPISDFRTTAELWQTYISRTVEHRGSLALKPHDVAAMMILLKMSRISWSPEVEDHWIDAAGYAACGYDCTIRQSD
jgi:hypothetical protein